jgi:hypothetical protein
MDLLTKTSQFVASIEKLGDIKLLVKASKAQEKAAQVSEKARKLFDKYIESREDK